MMKLKPQKRRLAIAAAAGMAMTGTGLLAPPAQAYPPGKRMMCSASEPWSSRPVTFNVNVTQGRPGATAHVHVSVRNKHYTEQYGTFDANGNATITVALDKWTSKRTDAVRIWVAVPGYDYFEHCRSTVVVKRHRVDGPRHGKSHGNHAFTAHGFRPNTAVTTTAVRGRERVVVKGTTNSSGDFTAGLCIPSSGTWTVVTTSGRQMATTQIDVSGKTERSISG